MIKFVENFHGSSYRQGCMDGIDFHVLYRYIVHLWTVNPPLLLTITYTDCI